RRQGLNGRASFHEELILAICNAHLVARASERLGETDQAIGLWVWQWPQQDAVHHAEDGRVRADAERERQCRDERESAMLEKLSDAEAYVGPERVHGRPRDYAPLRCDKP